MERSILTWDVHASDGDEGRPPLGPLDRHVVHRHRVEIRTELDLEVEVEWPHRSSSTSAGPNTSGPLFMSSWRWTTRAALSARRCDPDLGHVIPVTHRTHRPVGLCSGFPIGVCAAFRNAPSSSHAQSVARACPSR